MKIMALDVGEKTIGVALSDETETYAFPGTTILRQEGRKRDMNAVRELVTQNAVQEIVVGMPLMMDGSRGIQAEKVEAFIARLRGYVRIPIRAQDERLSTLEAERALIAADRSRAERRQIVDSMAASLILQTYLDRKRNLAAQAEAEGAA